MDTSSWLAVRREDSETVGYLEPLAGGYCAVQPRSAPGHVAGRPCELVDGEQHLVERGIGEPAGSRRMTDAPDAPPAGHSILEVSPAGIVPADALAAKALAPAERIIIPRPDLVGRLIPLR